MRSKKNDGRCCPINLQLFAEDPQEPAQEPNVEPAQEPQKPIVEDPKGQSQDKNHPANTAFAAQMRERKQAQRELEATKSSKAELDKQFAELAKAAGVENINSVEDYLKAVRSQEMSAKYKETQDPAIMAQMVAQELQQTQQAQQPQEDPYAGEIADLNKAYGLQVGTLEDLNTLDNHEQIIEYANKGLSLADAYLLANRDTIASKQTQSARQQALNQVKGTSHVKSNSQSGEIDTTVITEQEIENMRAFYPKASRAELEKYVKNWK